MIIGYERVSFLLSACAQHVVPFLQELAEKAKRAQGLNRDEFNTPEILADEEIIERSRAVVTGPKIFTSEMRASRNIMFSLKIILGFFQVVTVRALLLNASHVERVLLQNLRFIKNLKWLSPSSMYGSRSSCPM